MYVCMHTKTIFTLENIFPLWPVVVRFVWAFTRLRVDKKCNRENVYAVLNLHGYVWTGAL